MRKSRMFVQGAASLTLAACAASWAVAADGDPTDLVQDEAIVELKEHRLIEDVDRDYGTQVIASIPELRLHLLLLPSDWDEETFEDEIEHDSRVKEAQLNYSSDLADGGTQGFFYDAVPSDYDEQYSWPLIGLAPAQNMGRGEGVTIAVLDTGVDRFHPALADVDILPGRDFVGPDSFPNDVGNGEDDDRDGEVDELVGHGTFMVGLLAKIAPEATILPVRVLDSDGRGQAFHIAQGIYYAVASGADIINISLGTARDTKIMKEAIEYAHHEKVIIVAAAGNRGVEEPKRFPAARSKVIGVASTDAHDLKSFFSNYGKHVDVSAPGTDLVSILPGDLYARSSGTSLSTACVSGAAALIMSARPGIKASDVEHALIDNAVDIDDRNHEYKKLIGKGRIDVLSAIEDD